MNDIYVDKTIYDSAPSDARLPKETAVYELLGRLGIAYLRVDHGPAMTIGDCSEVDALLGVGMCKNLFLCNRQKTEFYLLMLPGDKIFRTKELSQSLGIARLSFADGSFMEEFLNITPGSLSVMGLMNDAGQRVRLIIDDDIAGCEFVGCHPCVNTSSLRIKTDDLLNKFLPYVKHVPTFVTLTGNES